MLELGYHLTYGHPLHRRSPFPPCASIALKLWDLASWKEVEVGGQKRVEAVDLSRQIAQSC